MPKILPNAGGALATPAVANGFPTSAATRGGPGRAERAAGGFDDLLSSARRREPERPAPAAEEPSKPASTSKTSRSKKRDGDGSRAEAAERRDQPRAERSEGNRAVDEAEPVQPEGASANADDTAAEPVS